MSTSGREDTEVQYEPDEEMAFIPRQVPLTPGTAGGMAVFVIFLISFTGLTMLERNDGVFFFAEHTRQVRVFAHFVLLFWAHFLLNFCSLFALVLLGSSSGSTIFGGSRGSTTLIASTSSGSRCVRVAHSLLEFCSLTFCSNSLLTFCLSLALQYHFVDGIANVSTRLDRYPGSSVVMIGPPRVRQIRYDANGVNHLPGGGLINRIYNSDIEDTVPFGRNVPDTAGLAASSGDAVAWSSGGQWQHQTDEITGDYPQSGRLHMYYSGGGYVLDLEPWLRRDSDEHDPGSEFYPFAHWKVNTTDLWQMGWIDKQTKAVIHDFTLYSAAQDLFAFCRVTAEFEGNSAVFQMQVNLRVFWLARDTWFMAIQYIFMGFLLVLIVGELQELVEGLQMAEKVLVESTVELKYLLRLKELQFAAEHGVPALYQPHRVLRKLAFRLYEADGSCVHHIVQLNEIGQKIPALQTHFDDAMRMLEVSGMQGSEKVFKPNPVVSAKLEKARRNLTLIRQEDKTVIEILQTWWLRANCSVMFYFQTEWNGIDSVNYTMLTFSFVLRVWSWSLMPAMREQIQELDRANPYAASNYINTFFLSSAFQFSFYVNAFSSILTWIKLFKFLSFFPEMSIFTKTVSLSAQHLGVFFFVVLIVIIGSAQGFCLAFGTDIAGFRDPFQATINVALFTVGKFNYDELVWSQRWFGPLLFWLYIFLVFFVMMSVFIAILSEGYESAKSVIPATASGNIWEAVQTVAVSNYRQGKQEVALSFRKVTGRNKVQDRWAAAGSKVRVGVKMGAALQAAQEQRETEAFAGKSKKRARTHKDANIATDSESDGEGREGEDIAYKRYMEETFGEKVAKVGTASMAARAFARTESSPKLTEKQVHPFGVKALVPYEEEEESQEEEEEEEEDAESGDEKRANDGGGGGGVDAGEALERLAALEDQVAALSEQKSAAAEKMTQLTDQIQSMGDEQSATLKKILESLAGARCAPEAGHAHHENQRGSSGGGGGHRRGSPQAEGVTATGARYSSPSSSGAHSSRGRNSPQDTSSRVSAARTSVPNMRQQMAATVSAASISRVIVKKKIPSMREQMAASAERQRAGSSASPPKLAKVMSTREQMAASAERSRSPQPQSASPPQEKKKLTGMRAQMEAMAARQAGGGGGEGAAPPKKKLTGMRAQMEAMAAQHGPAGP